MQLNARQNKSVKKKLATLKKHYRLPKEASVRPYRKQHLERSRIVVMRVCVVVL